MMYFILGLILFFATHFFTAFARGPRQGVIDRLGAMGYKGAYSLLSIAGFALIVIGWPAADATALYTPPAFLRHVTYLLTLVAMILVASAYLPSGAIASATKHPMVAGVKVWAFAHLLSNGEIRSVILFGLFLAYGVLDRIALKRRGGATPVRPAGGRGLINDGLAVVAGVALWAAIFGFLHPVIAGVALH